MSSEQDSAGGAALPRRFRLSRAVSKRIKIAVIGAVVSLVLGGAAWQIVLWTMPVDSYTVVEVASGGGLQDQFPPGAVIASYSSTDAGFATRVRQAVNNDPDASSAGFDSLPFGIGVLFSNCNGMIPYPPDHFPPYGTQYTMTFRSGGRVIETVTGQTNDCTLALVKCGIVSDWKVDAQPVPFDSLE
jgi:hypothetical protein